jgi:DDE family transposase
MTTWPHRALAMLTDFFSSDDIEAAARRTGLVKRASKLSGTLFLALVTFGAWSDATPTLAPLAVQVTQLDEQVEVSPEAIHQRRHPRARAFLQDMIHQALAKVQSIETVCDDGLFPCFTKGYLAARTGFALPESLHDLWPGSGGSAAKAGAKIPAVWDDKSRVFEHFVLPPWNIPDQKYVDHVIALAQRAALLLFALGYFKIQALARLALAGAYFLTRLKHQTTLFAPSAGGMPHVELAQMLPGGEGTLIARDICIGAKELVPSRLVAVRMPEPIVNERRRVAQQKAKKKGEMPSKAQLTLLAWHLCISKVPSTIGKTTTVVKGYPIRWQIERLFKSWKRSRHGASITTKKAATPLGYLYGRMLLIGLNDALCPHIRHHLWCKKKRALRVRKLVRPFQALAARWMHAICQAECVLRRFLQRACATAERLVAKAARKRQTTAQILRESLSQQHEAIAFVAAVNA